MSSTDKNEISSTSPHDTSSTTQPGPSSSSSSNPSQTTSQEPTSSTLSSTLSSTQTTQTTDPCQSVSCENGGTCEPANGNATCTCIVGFTGATCQTNIDDCQGNPCENGATCKDGNNTYTCQCSPGYEGENCSTDIDDCKGNPCMHGENCTDEVNSYTCHCVAGYSGQNCSIDIDECTSNPCENGATCNDEVNMYSCTCVPGYNGTNCEQDIDECVTNNLCENNSTCKNTPGNYSCVCPTGWTGDRCSENIDECKTNTHDCDRNANCTDFDGGFQCKCWNGFTGPGNDCTDINECEASNMTVCKNNATCLNIPGDYRCFCASGWTGDACSENIDECKNNSCAAHANCTDTQGSYICTCKNGYRGDGRLKCIQEVLISVKNVGQRLYGDDEIYGPYEIKGNLPFFGQMYNKFYASINGYITLGNVLNETYPPTSSSGWQRFQFPVIAPLWADIETKTSSGGVEITNVLTANDLDVIGKAFNVNNLINGIVVTWKKAVPFPYQQNENFEAADFQVVIGSTKSKTYMMFNYDQEVFTWKVLPDRNVAAGYYFNNEHNKITLSSDNFTSANKEHFQSTLKGRWIFNATSSSKNWEEKAACLAAVKDMNPPSSDPCPCSLAQAMLDTRFKYKAFDSVRGIHTYSSRFTRQPNNRRQLCNYSKSGSLVKGSPGGGYLEYTNSTSVNVTKAFDICCVKDSTCNLFYKSNPSDTCSRYEPPTWSLSWGDPHFTTLDGQNYTFNGRGEYTLLKTGSVKVQVRTEYVNINTKSASVFTGLAAQENGYSKVEVLLNRDSKTSDLYIDNVKNTTFPSTVNLNLEFNGVSIISENTTMLITFQSGLAIRVGVSDILNIVTSVPKDDNFRGKTLGLLGNNNGESKDDFKMKNGTQLNDDSSEKVLYSFGTSWMLSSRNVSLFGYHDSNTGRNFSFFNDLSIAKPKNFIADANNFTEQVLTLCNTSHGLNLSHCHGNKRCIVDTIGTCSKDFGEKSVITEDEAITNKKKIDHMPPVLEIADVIYVGYSQNKSLQFAYTQTNLQVTCKTDIPINSYKCDNTFFSWNVSQSLRNSSVSLSIKATDSMNSSSEYQPKIYYCGCEEEEQCDFSLIQVDGAVRGNFFRARCACPETRKGIYCEFPADFCYRNPCFDNVTCNSTLDNPCGPCPAGLSGDGVKCHDVDECRTNQSKCEQICNNIIGNYKCNCNKGYDLDTDGYKCKDIDECSRNKSYCVSQPNTYCKNTDGSAECLCKPGYTKNGTGPCIDVKEKSSYGGILVFKTMSPVSQEELRKPILAYLTKIFNGGGHVYFVEIVTFTIVSSARMKRDTTSYTNYKLDYIVHMNEQVSTESLQEDLTKTFTKLAADKEGFVVPNIGDSNIVIFVSTEDSEVFQDDQQGICNIPGAVTCDPISTNCVSANGTYTCSCKTGFDNWAYTSCRDIDECAKPSEVCKGGKNCTNYPGGYLCTCEPGFRYEKPNCVDMCDSDPCQNGGQCIHGDTEGVYVCKCDDKWTGPNCENENAEAEKLKVIAIAVGASVGAICLLLICFLFGMYRRNKKRYSGYRRRPLSSMDFDSSFGLASNNIRTKDFPIDDDTDTQFSIPRPKYNQNEYDTTDTDARTSYVETRDSETGKMEEPKTKLTKETVESPANGADNPSFLHSSNMESARRSSKRESKSAYDYF